MPKNESKNERAKTLERLHPLKQMAAMTFEQIEVLPLFKQMNAIACLAAEGFCPVVSEDDRNIFTQSTPYERASVLHYAVMAWCRADNNPEVLHDHVRKLVAENRILGVEKDKYFNESLGLQQEVNRLKALDGSKDRKIKNLLALVRALGEFVE